MMKRSKCALLATCALGVAGVGCVSQVEFGSTITSQGGMMELAIGAPKDKNT